jgi:hypothetical protein
VTAEAAPDLNASRLVVAITVNAATVLAVFFSPENTVTRRKS